MPPRIAFVIEQALGHVAYGAGLRRALAGRDDAELVWIEVPFQPEGLGRLPLVRNNWTLRGSLEAARSIRREDARRPLDAMFIHTQTIGLFAGGLMRRIPTLLSLDATPMNVDTLAGPYQHQVSPAPVEALKRLLHRRMVARARYFTTWSAWAKDSLVRNYRADAARVQVLHPGTDMTLFPPTAMRPSSPAAPLRVLFVGGDFGRKGGDVLVDAWQRLPAGSCELDIVTGSDVAPRPGLRVHPGLKPHSPELLTLYGQADVFALPTRGDCLAVVLGEAMAASLPIITTRVGAHAEAVDDGMTGYLVELDDAPAIAAHLARLAEDRALAASMGAASRALGEARFDMNHNAARIADMLVDLAAGNSIPAAPEQPRAVREREPVA
ncbi:MAG TPA: glycosyltransferase family 4 protein [Dehalococcoidia bacterium]|nr:glycosyltransferase family 4 protein [Dehalococcoidia bacterium]